jgi:hypothetical protein
MNAGLEIINRAAERFNEYCEVKHRLALPLHKGSAITGTGSPLDSLGVVNLVMEIELVLEENGWPTNLTNGEALAHLDTAGELAEYLEGAIV